MITYGRIHAAARNYRANDYEQQRLREVKQERCGVCWDRWPSSMMTTEDGLRRCPDCLAIKTEQVKAAILQHDAAIVAANPTRPQISMAPFREPVPAVRTIHDVNGNVVLPGSPLTIKRTVDTKVLRIIGRDFSSADTFSYSSGISNSVAPALSGSTQWTLTLVASGGMTPGDWHLTMNGRTYRGILRIR
jgi:hypothetical protein